MKIVLAILVLLSLFTIGSSFNLFGSKKNDNNPLHKPITQNGGLTFT